MRHALILSSVLFAASAISGAAMAQATNGEGLRYLSWPGKPALARTTTAQPTRIAAASTTAIPLARLPATAPIPAAPRNGLTPASAYYSPSMTSSVATAYVAPAVVSAPVSTPLPAPAPAAPAPEPAVPTPQPEPAPTEAADPMAPRRDAPIFRLQRQAETEAAASVTPHPTEQAANETQGATQPPAQLQAALAPSQGARFYSVHRQAGRQPDAIAAPQPIYLDALPVQLTQTPSSTDLAQPDGPPALLRSSNGTVRAMPQTQADDLP